MTTTMRTEILEALLELGKRYPSLRFGQLMCFVGVMVEPYPSHPRELADDVVLALLRERLKKDWGVPLDLSTPYDPDERSALVRTLEEVGNQYPTWSLGELLFRLASIAHLNLYGAEDAELLKTMQSNRATLDWFASYTEKLENQSTICARQDKVSYRCPCCGCLTLYERGGFEICPVCYWEDDGQDEGDIDAVRGGPNGLLSLAQGRRNYQNHKVCDPKYFEHVRPARKEEL